MKKKLITAALIICFGISAWAQQMPLYSQLYFMRMLYNPALTAYNGSTNVYLFDREQWTAMPGHPSTRGGMGEVSLWGNRSGVGITVVDDITSVINTVNAQLSYAQKIKLAKDHHLSLGLSFGLMQTRIDYSNLVATDVTDPHLLGSARGGLAFDMNVGLAYQWKKLTVSFAVEHAANSNIRIADQLKNTTYDTKRHYVGGISYEFSFKKEKWNLEPSILVKKGSGTPIQVDANIMANYKRFLYLGVGYRLDYGFSAQAAVRISQCVTLGYAYEYPIISHVSFGSTGGTHEVLVGINFDRWIKNAKKINKLEKEVKELKHDDTVLTKRVDSLQEKTKQIATDADDNKQYQKVQDDKIQELTNRVDTLEKQVKDYKDLIKKKAASPFPDGLNDINQDDIYKMDKIYFETNSSYLKSESFNQLNKLLDLLRANPSMKIKILGHTDNVASDTYNMWLSERRAKRVADYLTGNGIQRSRVTSVGFGKRAPIADNATEDGRAQNRRVEVQIISK